MGFPFSYLCQIKMTAVPPPGCYPNGIRGLSGEIQTMMDNLLAAIKLYAAKKPGVDRITYNGRFLTQTGEPYATWTPRLLQAAYDYQSATMDPACYSHNPRYIMQLLYDGIKNLGGPPGE
jgi:hypothetical protein